MLTKEELHHIGVAAEFHSNDNPRLSWDDYFMSLADLVSRRSPDSNTKHGAVFVRDNRIVACGFNGFPPGSPDEIMPNTRLGGHKYKAVEHSEGNAIYNAAREGVSLKGSTLYCTGHPCSECCKKLISVGVKNWIIGSRGYHNNMDDAEHLWRRFWVEHFDVKVTLLKKWE